MSSGFKKSKTASKNLLLSIIFLSPIPNLGVDIYTPSLPAMASSLNVSSELLNMGIVIYLITYGLGQLLFGVMTDVYGRKRILLFGMISFILFSFISGVITNIYFFLFCRLMLGFSVSIMSVVTKSMISDKFHGKRLRLASTYKVNSQILSLILAPVVGGVLQYYLDWRSNFFLLALYGLFAFILVILIPETNTKKIKFSFKVCFSVVSQMILNCKFMLMIICASLLYALAATFGIFGSYIVQNIFNAPSYLFGLSICALGLSYLFGSNLSSKISLNLILGITVSCMAISPILLALLSNYISLLSLLCVIAPIMFSAGLLLPRIVSYSLNLFRQNAGISSAVIGFLVMSFMGLILASLNLLSDLTVHSLGLIYLALCSAIIFFIFTMRLNQLPSF